MGSKPAKRTNYLAYDCILEVKVTDDYLDLLLKTGLGSRNAAGFGMMIVHKDKEEVNKENKGKPKGKSQKNSHYKKK